MAATANGARTVLLLPPDSGCSIERQIRLGGQLGSAMLVVIAGAADHTNIAHLASATTDIIFPRGGVVGGAASPGYKEPPAMLGSPPPALGASQEVERVGEDAAYDDGRVGGALNGDGERPGSVDRRRRLQRTGGGDKDRRERSRGGPERGAGSCPPLTVIVGHDEGKRLLEWLKSAGGGAVTASVAEREDVGKLWGDVVWASDPANWPKGVLHLLQNIDQ